MSRDHKSVAYVLYRYPSLSQAFIGREVRALEALGVHVRRYSLQTPRTQDVHTVEDETEYARTSVLPPSVASLCFAHLTALRRSPYAYFSCFRCALGEEPKGVRGWTQVGRAFLLAVWMWHDLRRSSVRHLHTHFAGLPSLVAWLTTEIGNRAGRGSDGLWTWSTTIHGPVEFFDARSFRLRERARTASFVAFVSEYARRQLLPNLDPRDWSKLHLVRCGVDPARIPVESSWRTSEVTQILSVGRHVPFKAFHVLLRAFAAMPEELRSRSVLRLVGAGDETGALLRLREDLGIEDRVEFVGAAGQDELHELYSEADLFCLPSVAESLPVVLMEAMTYRLPVIATSVGGIEELVRHEENGLICRPGDVLALAEALERLCLREQERMRMGEAGRSKVLDNFDVRFSAQRLSTLFHEVEGRKSQHL